MIMVIIGVLLVFITVLMELGGITAIHEEVGALTDGALLDPTSDGLLSPIMIVTTSMAWGLGTAANPQYIIRIVTSKDKKTGIRMFCISTFVLSGIICV
jgi:SSS family solute:Na+ symporter